MNKKYYRLHDDAYDIFPRYIEIDENGYALREVVEFTSEIKNTSLCIDDDFFLSEGNWAEVLEEIQKNEVSSSVFEEKWELSKEKYLSEWEKIKQKLAIGQALEAKIVCFYPQGIILDCGEKFFGIAPYDFCEKHFGKSQMYPKNTLKLQLNGFDEMHFWIKLLP